MVSEPGTLLSPTQDGIMGTHADTDTLIRHLSTHMFAHYTHLCTPMYRPRLACTCFSKQAIAAGAMVAESGTFFSPTQDGIMGPRPPMCPGQTYMCALRAPTYTPQYRASCAHTRILFAQTIAAGAMVTESGTFLSPTQDGIMGLAYASLSEIASECGRLPVVNALAEVCGLLLKK